MNTTTKNNADETKKLSSGEKDSSESPLEDSDPKEDSIIPSEEEAYDISHINMSP